MTIRQNTIDPGKVALYIRWSTDDQGEGTTLDVQLDGCKHYALSQGWTVCQQLTFIDDGCSGGNLERPALTRLREAVTRGEVDCVVVYKLDRLSRDVPDMIRLIMDEWGDRCYVKSAREPIDTTNQTGKMFFYTLASYAEWERSVIKDRTFSGKLRRAQEGKNPGQRPPYGYTYGEEHGTFALVPHEAEVVRRIYTMYHNGYGSYGIAIDLNKEGLPFRNGRPWHGSTVKHILRNPAYKGVLIFGVTQHDLKHKRRLRNEKPHLVREGVFPVIVRAEQWELVQATRRERPSPAKKQSGRAHSSPHLLTGLLRCPNCGRHMRVGSAGKTYKYYRCDGAASCGRTICTARLIRQDVLDGLVVEQLAATYGSEPARRAFMASLETSFRDERRVVSSALGEVEAALCKLEPKRKRLRSLVLAGELTAAEYREFARDVEADAAGLEERRRQLQQRVSVAEAAMLQGSALLTRAATLQVWHSLSSFEQKMLLRFFIQRIEAYLPRGSRELCCTIVWRVPTHQEAATMTAALPHNRRAR